MQGLTSMEMIIKSPRLFCFLVFNDKICIFCDTSTKQSSPTIDRKVLKTNGKLAKKIKTPRDS